MLEPTPNTGKLARKDVPNDDTSKQRWTLRHGLSVCSVRGYLKRYRCARPRGAWHATSLGHGQRRTPRKPRHHLLGQVFLYRPSRSCLPTIYHLISVRTKCRVILTVPRLHILPELFCFLSVWPPAVGFRKVPPDSSTLQDKSKWCCFSEESSFLVTSWFHQTQQYWLAADRAPSRLDWSSGFVCFSHYPIISSSSSSSLSSSSSSSSFTEKRRAFGACFGVVILFAAGGLPGSASLTYISFFPSDLASTRGAGGGNPCVRYPGVWE